MPKTFLIFTVLSVYFLLICYCGCDSNVEESTLGVLNNEKQDCGCSKLNRGAQLKNIQENSQETSKSACQEKQTSGFTKFQRPDAMIFIDGGEFQMGTNNPVFVADGEGPGRIVQINSFFMDIHEVSNAEFHQFVNETGYITEVMNFFLK